MSRRARLFSEFLNEETSRPTRVPSALPNTVELEPSNKRRKILGLNARLDLMVQSMNATKRSPASKSTRSRARSTSSASGSSIPKTPIDNEYEGRLGAGFSVIKMGAGTVGKKKLSNISSGNPWEDDSSSDTNEASATHAPLPSWLTDTFSTLKTQHPLRLLLPQRTNTNSTPSPPERGQDAEHNDARFSFSVHTDSIASSLDPSTNADADAYPQSTDFRFEPARLPPHLSTPGPYSILSISHESSVSPRVDEKLPFSTPGPNSIISHSGVPTAHRPDPEHTLHFAAATIAPKAYYTNHFPGSSELLPIAPLPSPNAQVPVDSAYYRHSNSPAHSRPRSDSSLPEVPSYQQGQAELRAPSFSALSVDGPYTHPVAETADSPSAPVLAETVGSPRNCIEESLSLDANTPAAYINAFSTPGPKYLAAPPPVYFDSPVEDPASSDPLEAGYELDSLDFRWEPFIQKPDDQKSVVGTFQPVATPPVSSPPVVSNSDDYYYETRVEPDRELDDQNGSLYASVNMKRPDASPRRFSFWPTDDEPEPSESNSLAAAKQVTPTTPNLSVPLKPASPAFFAPVPGIFISPLRRDEAPSISKQTAEAKLMDDPHGSQISNDTIEDWDDVIN